MGSNLWVEKLKRLMSQQGLTQGTLSEKLGITPRTLSDFLREDSGRSPTGATAKLIDLMLGDGGSAESSRLGVSLVVIHRDYVMRGGAKSNPVDTVVELGRRVGSSLVLEQGSGPRFRDEFHYVTVAPTGESGWALEESLLSRKIQPHFLIGSRATDATAMDCYFSALVMALASRTIGLMQIVLAADPLKFWPMGREAKDFARVPVTFVLDGRDDLESTGVQSILAEAGLLSVIVGGRQMGKVSIKKDGYGFIKALDKDEIETNQAFFFSWNDMKKTSAGTPEMPIENLCIGDTVSFELGENHMGPCATDIALVSSVRSVTPNSPQIVPRSPQGGDKKFLLDALREAVSCCADAQGWARLSAIGNRASALNPHFRARLQANGFQGIQEFMVNSGDFEVNGTGGLTKARIRS